MVNQTSIIIMWRKNYYFFHILKNNNITFYLKGKVSLFTNSFIIYLEIIKDEKIKKNLYTIKKYSWFKFK